MLDVIVISPSYVRRGWTLRANVVERRARYAVRRLHLGDALKRSSIHRGRFALTAWPLPPVSVGLAAHGRSGLGRLRCSRHSAKRCRAEIDVTSLTPEEAVQPARARRAAGGLSRRRRRLQRRCCPAAGHAAAPPRRPALPAPDQRPRGAGAVRRRDPRGHLVDRPPGARIHAAVRSADVARAPRRPPAPATAPLHSSAPAPARTGPHRRAAPARTAAARQRRTRPRRRRARRAARRRRAAAPRQPATAGRRRPAATSTAFAPATRCRASPARTQRAGRVARPDAGVAVPRQPAGLHRQQHEPAEVGRGAGRAERRRGQGVDARRGARRSSRPRAPTSAPTASGWPAACRPRRPSPRARPAARCRRRSKTASRPLRPRRTS